jgi:hypothetical protein
VLLNAAKKAWECGGFKEDKKYLQVSTDEVYGSLGETGHFMESTQPGLKKGLAGTLKPNLKTELRQLSSGIPIIQTGWIM